ncbi:protein TolA, partial [Acinetobacter nectaris]|nr:protein TolA [Acinetobacter nectaris]
MKKFDKQPFDQQKAKAIGFTLGVHAVALIALLYFGTTPPPKPKKELTTYLVSADQIADTSNNK